MNDAIYLSVYRKIKSYNGQWVPSSMLGVEFYRTPSEMNKILSELEKEGIVQLEKEDSIYRARTEKEEGKIWGTIRRLMLSIKS